MAITLIIEDGTLPSGANTYAAIATADAYHQARGFAAWDAATEDEKASALIRATDYLNGLSWMGTKVERRVMAWPRYDVVDGDGWDIASNVVPEAVVNACCYMAGEFVGGADPLAAQDRTMSSMSVGSISMSWDAGASQTPQYPALRWILRGLIMSPNTIQLVRG